MDLVSNESQSANWPRREVHQDERVLNLIPGEDAYWLPQDPAFLPYLELAFKEHPNLPTMEEERAARARKFDDAMRKWKATGVIPTGEN